MSTNDDEELSAKLIETIEDIRPDKLKTTSHTRYLSQLREIAKQIYSCHATVIIIQSIKDCEQSSYKRDVLVELLDSLVNDGDFLRTHLLCKPFGSGNLRAGLWREFANSLTSIHELVANLKLLDNFTRFRAPCFYSRLLDNTVKAIQTLSSEDDISKEHCAFLLQVVGRIAMRDRELVWLEFSSRAMELIETDNQFCSLFKLVFQQPFSNDSLAESFQTFMNHLYLPIFEFAKPSEIITRKIQILLGPEAMRSPEFCYILCDRSILKANCNRKKLRQKMILANIFSYLSQTDSSEQDVMHTTLSDIISSWSSGTKVLLRLYEHSRYITWALIVGFRFAFATRKEQVKFHAREYQSMIVRAVPIYLSRADDAQRDLGIVVAELILPEIHKLISDARPLNNEIEFPKLIKPDKQSEFYKESYQLFHNDLDSIFQEVPMYDSRAKRVELPNNKPHIEKQQVISASTQKKKVIDSDDDDVDDSEEDEVYGEELARVPIYLRDCVDGLMDHSSNSRYIRLCLTRASELVEKLAVAHQEYDTIKDVGVELAKAVLYLENQYNLNKFESHRLKILTSLCSAAPELVSNYLLEEFNGSVRSMRQQFDILQALVASAKQISTIQSKQAKIDACKINAFTKYAPLYFYGIANRLKSDFLGQNLGITTPQPRSILSAFRKLRQDSNSEKSLGSIILPKAIKMSDENSTSSSVMLTKHSLAMDDKVFELETVSDDSYLLSRILISLAMILRCASQQHVLCNISNDLIDILKAYRCHPDIGVQKAIVTCLKSIQECAPKVYFSEYLQKPMVQQFGAWLESKSLAQ